MNYWTYPQGKSDISDIQDNPDISGKPDKWDNLGRTGAFDITWTIFTKGSKYSWEIVERSQIFTKGLRKSQGI